MEGQDNIRKKIKISDEMGMDRLNNLPDSVIHQILSLMDAKYAVRTCVLSKKWKFHWAHVPCYRFNDSTTSSDVEFQDFVANVFNDRKLFNLSRPTFRVGGITMSSLVEMFRRYVLSCRFEELDVRKKVQINDQMVVDRLSSLPDSIIHNILSFTDTKYAVQTSVLSKRWRNQWTNIHNLNFDHSSFSTWVGFKEFVSRVLWRRKPIDVQKLKIICGRTVSVTLLSPVFLYAQFHKLKELETDAIGYFPRSDEDGDAYMFDYMTTLRLSATLPSTIDLLGANDFRILKNLHLVNCALPSGSSPKTFTLYSSSLNTLTISDFSFCEKIEIAASVQVFNLKRKAPCLLSFIEGCGGFTPARVNIHISPPADDCGTKKWFTAMGDMVQGCCGARSITVLLTTPKGTFILYKRSYSYYEVEAKVMELNKETGEERLVVSGFDLNEFATILERIFEEKKELNYYQIEIDRLSNLPKNIIYHILSFLDTKSAVQTCILSKIWRYHWTHIRHLNLECRSNRITNFKNFVLHVLHHRKPLNLKRLRFHLSGAKSQALMRIISSYALSKSLEELDTNLTTFLPSFYQCRTLRTLKLGSCSRDLPDLSSLTSLMTLELTNVWLPADCDFFSRCLILENLSITECQVMSLIVNISAPKLIKLIISNFRFLKKNSGGKIVSTAPNDGKILITAPRLKFFNLKEVDPLVLSMDDCQNLEKVDIHMSQIVCQTVCNKKQTFILDTLHMVEGLFHVKSPRILLNLTKEKFILCRNNVDEETKIAVLNKETGVEELLGLATVLEEF